MPKKETKEIIRCSGHYRNIDQPCGWELAVKTKYSDGRIEFKIFSGIKTKINDLGIPEIICPMCSHANSDSDFTTYCFQNMRHEYECGNCRTIVKEGNLCPKCGAFVQSYM